MRGKNWVANLENVLATALLVFVALLLLALLMAPSILMRHADSAREWLGIVRFSATAVTLGLAALSLGVFAVLSGFALWDSRREAWSLGWEWDTLRCLIALIGCVVCLALAFLLG